MNGGQKEVNGRRKGSGGRNKGVRGRNTRQKMVKIAKKKNDGGKKK